MKQLLNYSVAGNGLCVVLLHGLMEDIHIWEDLVDQLTEYFQVICIDLPGHGKSPLPNTSYSIDYITECVNDVLVQLHIEKCVMIGHSMGGYVMTAFARLFPYKLSGICFLNSHALPDSKTAFQNRENAIMMIQNDKQAYIADFMDNMFTDENKIHYKNTIDQLKDRANKMLPEAIIAAHRSMQARNSGLSVLIEAIFPVLFIAGKNDRSISIDKIMAQALLPKHAEILILDNVAHIALIEAKQTTNDMIESFADRCFCH